MSSTIRAAGPLQPQDPVSEFTFPDPAIEALHQFARQCAGQGLYGKAAEAYEAALRRVRDAQRDRSPEIAQLHLLLAGAYRATGERDKAVSHLRECVSASQAHNGGTNLIAASALNQLGMLAVESSDEREAEVFYKLSLHLLQQLPSQGASLVAAVTMNLGLLHYHQARFEDAKPLLDRAVAFVDDPATPETADTAQMINTLAWVQYETRQFEKARQLAHRALGIRTRLLGGAHPHLADSFDLLAEFASDAGDFNRELAWLRLALSFREQALGLEHLQVADTLSRTADAQESCGLYAEALASSERALRIREGTLGIDNHAVASSLLQLAGLKSKLWNSEEALALAQRAHALELKQHGPTHPDVANCLEALAAIHLLRGDTPNSIASLGRCLQIRDAVLGPARLTTANTLESFALLGLYIGQDQLRALKTAVTRKEQLLGPESPWLVTSLLNLGRVYRERGQFSEAEECLRRAEAIARQSWGTEHPSCLAVRREQVFLQARQEGELATITPLADLLRSERLWLSRQLTGLAYREAVGCLHMLLSDLCMLHSSCGSAREDEATEPRMTAVEQSARSKGLYEDLLVVQAKLQSDPSTSTREPLAQWQSLRLELDRLAQAEPNPGRREQQRRALQGKLSSIATVLQARTGIPSTPETVGAASFGVLRSALPRGSALCDIVQFWRLDATGATNRWHEARYAAYMTFSSATESPRAVTERVDLGETGPIDEALAVIVKRMSAGQFAAKDLSAALQRLSDLVYGPLASYLTNVSHLIICPDGQLSRLPFEMLSHDGRFLIEEKTITYVGSGREVVRLAQPPVGMKTNAPVVMGNPDFDLDLARTTTAETQTEPVASAPAQPGDEDAPEPRLFGAVSPGSRSLSRDYRGLRFDPLPGAEAEARETAKLLGGDALLRLGAQAREAELKAVVSPRVLHISTHGFFLSDQEFKRTNNLRDDLLPLGSSLPNWRLAGESWENPMIRCGLALAGANHARQITNAVAEDGLLTGLEAALLNLQGTELVVLSACDSGTGDVKIGEGVMSLRRAFRIAGAQTVLASHWKVNDRATARLMTEFMRRWQAGEPRGEAWRQAQLSLLRSPDFSNPYFWAAFTLTGQWR